jgi:hypothetical protein
MYEGEVYTVFLNNCFYFAEILSGSKKISSRPALSFWQYFQDRKIPNMLIRRSWTKSNNKSYGP